MEGNVILRVKSRLFVLEGLRLVPGRYIHFVKVHNSSEHGGWEDGLYRVQFVSKTNFDVWYNEQHIQRLLDNGWVEPADWEDMYEDWSIPTRR